ncbi:hypothetical protein [Burkholderia perseverans]|uniref:hypothetical protein n=1 Tax=Burkholderia perseverans TaxID=2615214 RepID=UPI001FED4A0F|nr:hypothetical protein [Burkholderia perseverans]
MLVTCPVCNLKYYRWMYPRNCPACGAPTPRDTPALLPERDWIKSIDYGRRDVHPYLSAERLNQLLGGLYGTSLNIIQYPFRYVAATVVNQRALQDKLMLRAFASLTLNGLYNSKFSLDTRWTPYFDGQNQLEFKAHAESESVRHDARLVINDLPLGNVFLSSRRKERFYAKYVSENFDKAVIGRIDVELQGDDFEFGQDTETLQPARIGAKAELQLSRMPDCVITASILEARFIGSFMKDAPWKMPLNILDALRCKHDAHLKMQVDASGVMGLNRGALTLEIPFGISNKFNAVIVDEPMPLDEDQRIRARIENDLTLTHIGKWELPAWGIFNYNKRMLVTMDRAGKPSVRELPAPPPAIGGGDGGMDSFDVMNLIGE